MATEYPRVLVGCPTCDRKEDSLEKYVEGLHSLTYPNMDIAIEDNSPNPAYSEKIKKMGEEWESMHPGNFFRVIYSGFSFPRARERIVNGRNILRKIVLEEKYDYFFSLEQDIVTPPQTIERLLSHQKKAMSGIYYNRLTLNGKEKILPLVGIYLNDELREQGKIQWMDFKFLFPSRVAEVGYAGLGGILIHRSVLEKIVFRFDETKEASDDSYFCIDLQKNNFSLFADTGLLYEHRFNEVFKYLPPQEY